jgi:adenosylmethionine-8-amino-7-oxononanoate aminotransferase
MSKYLIFPFTNGPVNELTYIDKTDKHHVYTKNDEKLLDYTYSIAFTLGYSNKEIIDEICNELMSVSRCQTPRAQTTDSIEEVSSWLCETGDWAGYAWSVTGTGAVECGISMNDRYWKNLGNSKKKKIISFSGTWHGTSYLTKSLAVPFYNNWNSDRSIYLKGASWRFEHEREEEESRVLRDVLENIDRNPDSIGAILFDPVPWFQTNQYSERFWKEIRSICDTYDILMIVDDVACGFGKMGTIHTHKANGGGIQSDISCLGKAITAGHAPLSAAVCNKKVKDVIVDGFDYGHTYCPYMGGIGAMKAVKRIYERDKILDNVPKINGWLNNMGDYFLNQGLIRSYRTAGVMMSMDLTTKFQGRYQHKFGLSGKLAEVPNLFLCAPLIADEAYMEEITEKFSNIFLQ